MIASQKFFLAALLLLYCAACSEFGLAATPTPLVFDTPSSEISTFTLFFHQGCHFGYAVDMDGDRLAAGAPCWAQPPGEGAGTVYVLRKSPNGELALEATLVASDRDDGFQYDQHFGASVALHGTVIAVGVPGYDNPQVGDNTGAVYIYEFNGSAWMETARLTANRPKSGAKMGRALSFEGNLLAVSGSPEDGSVHIFQREGGGGWRELTQVPVPSAASGGQFNTLLDLYGDTLAVSVVEEKHPPEELNEKETLKLLKTTGVVTIFERVGDEWHKTFQTPPQEASLYRMYGEAPFGMPVSLGGEAGRANWLAVGKPGFTESGRETGSVAIFARGENGWRPQNELFLEPGEPVPGALPFFGRDPGPIFFGAFVKIEGNRLAVVSTFAHTAYVFERTDQEWAYRFRLIPGKEEGRGDDFQSRTIAISGNSLLMGSPGELGGGEVYLFDLQP